MVPTTSRRGEVIGGINVTPMVDIMLVLLVIFIVTAKITVAPAIGMDLPRAAPTQTVQLVFAVKIAQHGEISLDDQPISGAQLGVHAQAALREQPDLRAVIAADRLASHGRVLDVMELLAAAGLTKIAFAVEASEPPSTNTASATQEQR